METNLTAQQSDYAVFLPALSSFYATFVGKQRDQGDYVDPARIPAHFVNGVESGNWLAKGGLYQYKWSLYSAGHAEIDVNKHSPKEDMVRNRDHTRSIIVGDSGGFQIGKGVWEGDWKDPNCPKAHAKRDGVLRWMDTYMDWGMVLDIPAWVARSPEGQRATGITTYQEAVNGTEINNNYWMANRNGNCKFLNVLQGETHAEADDWYDRMKKFCDPKQYENHFNGWAMGGQNMCDVHLILKRIVTMMRDGLLEKGVHEWMHFLGTSKLEWAVLLTDIQRSVRKHYNDSLTISFDCASPFLATANGQVYCDIRTEDAAKWSYIMRSGIDDRGLSSDTTQYGQAFVREGCNPVFYDSPVSKDLRAMDICKYKPGEVNKNGKESVTSWDSFSYFLLMSHNVWTHIHACQEANRQYDNGLVPGMMQHDLYAKYGFRELVDEIIGCADSDDALQLINEHSRYWMSIIGTRGATGKKTVNSTTMFNNLFTEV